MIPFRSPINTLYYKKSEVRPWVLKSSTMNTITALVLAATLLLASSPANAAQGHIQSVVRMGCEIQNCKVLCFNRTLPDACANSTMYPGNYEAYTINKAPAGTLSVSINEFGKDSSCNASTPSSVTTLIWNPLVGRQSGCPLGVQLTKATHKSAVVGSLCDAKSLTCGKCSFTSAPLTEGSPCSVIRKDLAGNPIYGRVASITSVRKIVLHALYASIDACMWTGNSYGAVFQPVGQCNRGAEFFPATD